MYRDAANQLNAMLHVRSGANPATLQHFQYTLDANGNRTTMGELVGGTAATTAYTYDPLQRLTQVAYPAILDGPAASTVPYTLDAMGNRLSDGATTTQYDAGDRIVGYTYDKNGNLRNDGATVYEYDAANRLTSTTRSANVTSYAYDGWGSLIRERVQQSSMLTTTDFVLDEQRELPRVIGEIRSDGSEVLYAYGPDGVAAQRTIVGGTVQPLVYPLLDGLGSVRHLTHASGTLIRSLFYDAWGTVRYSTGTAWTRLGYAGEPMGTVDGLI